MTVEGTELVAAVTTKKLDTGAVKSGKLAGGAVTTSKLADGAVTTTKLSSEAVGVPLAGILVGSGGGVQAWFNRPGGQPTVDRTSEGRYSIQLPGFDGFSFGTAIQSATLQDPAGGEIVARTAGSSATAPIPVVDTFDSAGNPADRNFYYTVSAGQSESDPAKPGQKTPQPSAESR